MGISFSEDVENGYIVERISKGRNIAFSDGSPLSENIYDCFDIAHLSD